MKFRVEGMIRVGVLILFFSIHFMDSFFYFHSCKVDPHWYGARTSNPWENKRSAVRFRLLYVFSIEENLNRSEQRQMMKSYIGCLLLFIYYS